MQNQVPNRETLVKILDLKQHPEGGFYKETYRSVGTIKNDHLEGNYEGDRHFSTAIYFMLTEEMFSAFHKIEQDELWHFHLGSTIELHTISPEGNHKTHLISNNFENGHKPQLVVPGGYWFAAKILGPEDYALVSCTVAPGFDFRDFVLPSREELTQLFPKHKTIIDSFTRD